jgi:hypothetical protein
MASHAAAALGSALALPGNARPSSSCSTTARSDPAGSRCPALRGQHIPPGVLDQRRGAILISRQPGGDRGKDVSRGLRNGMPEPDPDRGHVDGSAPDEVALVITGGHGAMLAELAERPLDDVALIIGGGVEGDGQSFSI